MNTDIRNILPTNDVQAILNANSPSATNPFITAVDLAGSANLITSLIGANLNTLSDQPIVLPAGNYVIFDVVYTNSSIRPTLAENVAIWTGVAQSGGLIVTTDTYQVANDWIKNLILPVNYISILSYQANWRKDIALPLLPSLGLSTSIVSGTLQFSVGTVQGAACTCDIYIYGRKMA